jgi:hypothetical protein
VPLAAGADWASVVAVDVLIKVAGMTAYRLTVLIRPSHLGVGKGGRSAAKLPALFAPSRARASAEVVGKGWVLSTNGVWRVTAGQRSVVRALSTIRPPGWVDPPRCGDSTHPRG